MSMRRTSQSMYQSSMKMPASKIIDGSALAKSAYPNNVTMPNRSSVRKVEGQDFQRGAKTAGRGNFEQTVTNLKNRPTQKVLQDEYIGGLQEQIKFLEYELKLLKDKELIEREGVNQLDNFLKDEIPINENILAMKNKYNSTKSSLEEKYIKLNQNKAEAEGVLSLQKQQIENLHRCINTHRKQINDRRDQFKSKLSDLVKELSLTRDQYDALSQDNKRKQEEIKSLNEKLATLLRKQEKEKVEEVRLQEEKQKKAEKFGQNFKLTKEQLVESLQQMEELEGHGESNPLLQPLEQQNSTLRKKIMLNQKQKSTAENIIAEIDLFLKQQARERETERQQKSKLTNQAEAYRLELQNLQRYVDSLIKQQTLRTKKKMLKEMTINLREKEENYELLTDRLRNLEQECSNFIQEKKELNDALETEKNISKEFNEKIEELDHAIMSSKSRTDSLNRIISEVQKEIPPTDGELQKCKGRIPLVQKQIEKKKVIINHLNKQIDLLKELKTLDMQQLQMISTGGSNVQNVLHSFIKNWEKIKNV